MDAIIIGAGPAGLAVGACLRRAGAEFVILEQADQIAASWRRHYDRLRLHTAKAFSALPYFPFPKSYPRYPSRDQVVSYLEQYAQHFQLEPKTGQRAIAAYPVQGGWEVQTQDSRFRARCLVVAAGQACEPVRPTWPGMGEFGGEILHSAEYRNCKPYGSMQVLVVGFGNSGGEIAVDLWEHGAQPSMAVRSPVNVIPREVLGVPNTAISMAQAWLPRRVADALNTPILRARFGDLTAYGLGKPPRGPLAQIEHDGRIPLIDVGTIKLIKQGQIRVFPGIERFTRDGVVFTNGQSARFDTVILATGYRPRVDAFLHDAELALDEYGAPKVSGRESAMPRLYFCGYYVSPTGMLHEIAGEAKRIAAGIIKQKGGLSRSG